MSCWNWQESYAGDAMEQCTNCSAPIDSRRGVYYLERRRVCVRCFQDATGEDDSTYYLTRRPGVGDRAMVGAIISAVVGLVAWLAIIALIRFFAA
jgi:recombinational DNA repair protein (RecF pathway)